ncbi:DUF4126 domain-containing protein [Anthocerotibacter panamensis]|uniref:DUF4126 domain-containing protein n=1 Tax=Anthocerotibacter panamensis TaxID=2857077 RepID=UPI001C404873|nr:DUF4126 domain-containing protein [Anthocerotibacter panamensis]
MLYLLTTFGALAAAAAGGIRLSLPLLLLVIFNQSLGMDGASPVLAWLYQPQAITFLCIWAFFEVFGSKTALGQRLVRGIQFFMSPVIGALLATVMLPFTGWLQVCLVVTGAVLAAILQLAQTGYVFRHGLLPFWFTLCQDFLAVGLVLMALQAPLLGGLSVLLLVLLALRQTYLWQGQFGLKQGRT